MMAPLRLAFQALFANKLRSALTMLGNIIGVMCVVALVNIGISGRAHIQNSLSSIGENLIFVFSRYEGETPTQSAHWRPLNAADVSAVREGCESSAGVSPVVMSGAQVSFGSEHATTQLRGVSPEYFDLRKFALQSGQLFTAADIQGSAKVCVLGDKVVHQLFGNLDPLGQTVRINRQPFVVLGTLEKKGTMLTGEDQDNIVIAPVTSIQERITGTRTYELLLVSARHREDIPKLKEEVLTTLRLQHHLPPSTKSDVAVTDLGQASAMVDNVMMAATALLSAIAFISLLVGGIGIMNIMLVSITERTREIGLRMAVGATDFNILLQFLVEAVVMSAVGGSIGVVLGLGLSCGVSAGFGWPASLSPLSVGVALAFSAAVGVFFGLYPAWRASQLDPIVALRND